MSRIPVLLSLLVLGVALCSGALRSRRQVQLILPPFQTHAHGVSSGNVIILDSRRILIKNLKYDGAGPDAYFWVGKGTPNAKGHIVPNEFGASDVLKGYDGTRDIELTLPADHNVNKIDYLSIYCVAFAENFGHVLIPSGVDVPEYSEV